ncbi:hypothetical protein RF55_14896 [Lasius niger]|uniref:Uncharacterized protein n=1 Tax=Lasius niger TaxID=67767 RepID=A0A0J7K7G5_LASNI|nr:hypothetical protein RF55_14896 [Lasius niger]
MDFLELDYGGDVYLRKELYGNGHSQQDLARCGKHLPEEDLYAMEECLGSNLQIECVGGGEAELLSLHFHPEKTNLTLKPEASILLPTTFSREEPVMDDQTRSQRTNSAPGEPSEDPVGSEKTPDKEGAEEAHATKEEAAGELATPSQTVQEQLHTD